jgi:hypothetical protein
MVHTMKKIGRVGVDSGTLMIVDPAYIDSDIPSYDEIVGLKGKAWDLSTQLKNKKGIDTGVAFQSGYGDGVYDVFAEIGDTPFGKRVKSVRIDLVTPKETKFVAKVFAKQRGR